MRNREEYPDHTHTRSAPSSEARGAPARRVDALRRAPRPHHLGRGLGGRGFDVGFSVGAEQAFGTPFASPAGEPAIRRPRRSGCASVALSLCAHTARIRLRDGRGCWWARQHAVGVPMPLARARGREVPGSRLGPHGAGSVLSPCSVLRRRRAACRQSFGGAKAAGRILGIGASRGGGLRGHTCMPRGRGRRPTTRTGCRTPEDHATPPRRSARAQTAPPRRGRRVWRSARFNQKCTTR